ncbi:LOW QUALITY PROTEIN: choline O-acetyltransferase, partial [Nilaparvata lugens]|uniref:LOW QUALITY PROTEIN: choline O-acetyltransferase n=1 Tax=Nilaparvata lugens TaxID=108931 RepID=UPI00193D741D
FQIIIGNDGAFGICCEHSPAEGIAVVQLTEQILESCKELSLGKIGDDIAETTEHLQQLQWTIQPALKKHIREASQSLNNLVEDLDLYIYRFAGYGKNFIKKCAVSPDAYIQLALQLTYHKMYGRLTATYESASTRRFRLGRVDCIRSASAEAAEWTRAMNQQNSADDSETQVSDPLQPGKRVTFNLFSEKEKLTLFDAAVKKQTEIMIENILGDGIDCHLLGLREQSKLLDQPMDLFKDESYRIANHFALSTSQ